MNSTINTSERFNNSNTVLLIDGSSFIFRAFHAMPDLTSPSGEPTGAVHGIVNMLKLLQKKYNAIQHFACIFDSKGKTFRDEIYPDYKKTRKETPPELIAQINYIHEIIAAMGIPVIKQTGIEADDIIGTIAKTAVMHGKNVLIATGDKDFAQLVSKQITLINTMTNEILDIDGVINKFGVRPDQIVDYLSLVGDNVDNVPGVEKCGPKTALKWLTQYDNLANIITNSHLIPGVVGENLRNTTSWLATAKKLIIIDTNMPLANVASNSLEPLLLLPPDYDKLIELCSRLGLRSWLKELQTHNLATTHLNTTPNNDSNELDHSNSIIPVSKEVVKITTTEHLQIIIDSLVTNNTPIALFFLGNNYPKPTALRLTIIATLDRNYVVWHHQHNDLFAIAGTDSQFEPSLKQLLQSNIAKTLINYKDSLNLLSRLWPNDSPGLILNNVTADLTLAHYIYNSRLKHDLAAIFSTYCNLNVINLPSHTTPAAKDSIWYSNDNEAILENCLKITNNVTTIYSLITAKLDGFEQKIYEIELKLVPILVSMENTGIMLDGRQLKTLENKLADRISSLENAIYEACGCVFNLNSPKQLQEVLFSTLKLPTTGIKKNSNAYSTDEESLKILADQGIVLATYLLEYRMLTKLLSTYVSKLPQLVDQNSRLHTTFEQALVASSRLSSVAPNLQNIPIKNDWSRQIRQAFIAKPGYTLICADYSQIELRILAHFSQDHNLIDAFNSNQDIHSITACEIFNKSIMAITKEERRYAKTINFSLLYGKTVYGLAKELNVDHKTAKNYIERYFAKYPKVEACLTEIKNKAHANGYVSTVLGRKIYLPNINSSNRILREAEERVALNAPMQGTTADIVKIAMLNLEVLLQTYQSNMILQVHDELIIECPVDQAENLAQQIKTIMAGALKLAVNLVVDVKIASNWDSGH